MPSAQCFNGHLKRAWREKVVGIPHPLHHSGLAHRAMHLHNDPAVLSPSYNFTRLRSMAYRSIARRDAVTLGR